MLRFFAALVLLAPPAAAQEASARARAAARELGDHIRSLLAAELAAGGFAGAVSVCAEKAQAETKRYAAEQGIRIRRVSLKARNAANQPDEWERARLTEWEDALKQGRPLPDAAEGAAPDGAYRLLLPIRVQALCLTCHGSHQQIPAEVKAIITKLYPEDAATGYRNGDLRGAFSVAVPR